mmetsp:Transcript_27644/g.64306  ORF Transcript_27644/g.64306 Transcript_27644/m.64306 type:complete len:162 (-) Transcript_27644:69-554(-)
MEEAGAKWTCCFSSGVLHPEEEQEDLLPLLPWFPDAGPPRKEEEEEGEGAFEGNVHGHVDSEILEDAAMKDVSEGVDESKRAIVKATTPYMTKYERARILGTRALQISMNAPVLVEVGGGESDPLRIAMRELKEGKVPFVIRRYLPDGTFEDWGVNELLHN